MEGQINEWIFYASAAVLVAFISVFAYYLYVHKKREGMSYSLAIQKLKVFIRSKYGQLEGNQERFCEEYGITEKDSFLAVLQAREDEVLFPQVIAEALSAIGPPVVHINRNFYVDQRYAV